MATGAGYPVHIHIPRPERQSRLTNFPLLGLLIRLTLLIPHLLILMVLGVVSAIVGVIASFGILFTGNYPRGMFNFVVSVQRWTMRINCYIYHLRDEYPPFGFESGDYPVSLEVDYPDRLNRFLNFPFFGMYIKMLMALPHLLVLNLLAAAVALTTLFAEFGILFTGSYPELLHRLSAGVMRWNQRVGSYIALMTDKYPPFGL